MKRVYVVFEDKHENGGAFSDYYCDWYDDKFVDVYDTPQAAIASIHDWADSLEDVLDRKTDKASEELIIRNKKDPYSSDSKTFVKRVVKSTLLKSS